MSRSTGSVTPWKRSECRGFSVRNRGRFSWLRMAWTTGATFCSRHRRGALYRIASELGSTVLALGHTADDCAESLLRNVLFNGRVASLPPVARSRKGEVRLIRPLVYVSEASTAAYVEANAIGTVNCACAEFPGPRTEIRSFLDGMSRRHEGIRESIRAALGNVNPYTLFDPDLKKSGADEPVFSREPAV